MDQSLKPVLPQHPELEVPQQESIPPVDHHQKTFLFIVLICFFVALSAISFYVLYTKNTIDKSDMMVEDSEVMISSTPEYSSLEESEGKKMITYKYWKFSVANNWDYFGCAGVSHLFIGEVTNGRFLSGFPLPTEKDADCGFDGTISDITFARNKGLMTPYKTSIPSPENTPHMIVSQVQTVQIAGKQATVQFEDRKNGQGQGQYWVAYIPYGEGSDVITLSDVTKKDIFDALLASLSYTDFSPTPTAFPSPTFIPTPIPQITYTDPDNYFSFTYPSPWKIRKTYGPSVPKVVSYDPILSGVDLQYQYDQWPTLVIVVYDANGLSLDDWLSANRSGVTFSSKIELTVNGYRAIKWIHDNRETIHYSDGKYVVSIAYHIQSYQYNQEVQQIISSFKMLRS